MKIPDTTIRVRDIELRDFLEFTQIIINRGLYCFRTFDAVPDWAADEGEQGVLVSGDTLALAVHVNSVWALIGFNSVGSLSMWDRDGDTGITPEYTPDEDVIRFYSFGTYVVAMDTYGLQVSSGYKVVFDGLAGDSYWTYDGATNYLQAYVDGTLRMEM